MGLCISSKSGGSRRYDQTAGASASSAGRQVGQMSGRTSVQGEGQLGGLGNLRRNNSSVASSSRAPRADLSAGQVAVSKVLKKVRNDYYKTHFKSSNKWKTNGGDQELLRLSYASHEIANMREKVFDSDYTVIDVALDGQAHNCEELARLATFFLQEDGLPARMTHFGSVHGVAIIGADAGELPEDMRTWSSDIYVCDPWCNIACRAIDYPDQFVAKMEKWESEGKKIAYSASGYTSATDEDWIRAVLDGKKVAH